MSEDQKNTHWVFPKWHNKVPLIILGIVGPLVTVLAIGGVWYYFSPRFTDVGYRPEQPIPYSHKLHVGELGLDCRYCHTGVEISSHAQVPPSQTCMNCHSAIRTDSPKLLALRESWVNDKPIEWVRVHKTPDYAYFEHSAHIQAGVGCESCHGRIDQMVEVTQAEPLNMGWCLDCHRNPEQHLRPKDKVTVMGYKDKTAKQLVADQKAESADQAHALILKQGKDLKEANNINPPEHCSGCHR
jgi:hypothetical protein